jgi:hypothetical protein
VAGLWTTGLAVSAHAQAPEATRSPGHQLPSPSAAAVRIDEPIVLDARFEEAAWARATPITEFMQREPREGDPASERTEVRLLYDAQHLYIGIYCYDSDPRAIVATELRRDAEMEGDDIFEVIFDTFHDHRGGYRFRVNPLGTIRDQTVNEEGRVINDNWDERWSAAARIVADGWTAEMAIPFTAVRFPTGGGVAWGMNMHRTIMRKNEEVFWSGFRRGYTLTRLSGAGHLEPLSEIRGLRLRVKPYAAGRTVQTPDNAGVHTALLGDVGLADAKLLVTPQIAMDLTVNPDFAQTDVDQAQVNLSRFNLFFPEKREFFQEGSGLFQFGTGSRIGSSTDLLLFHSRRIGLSERREEIPIIAGAKLTGRQGLLELGALNMQTDDHAESAGQNFTVVRAKASVLPRSYVGAMLTRNTGSPLGGNNVAVGTDANFSFFRFLTVQAFLARTESTGLEGRDWAGRAAVSWNSDRYQYNAEHMRVGENFRPEMGFVRRAEPGWKGLRQSTVEGGWKPRPPLRSIRQFIFSAGLDYLTDQHGLLMTREARAGWDTHFESGDIVGAEIARDFERLVVPFRIAGGGGTVPAGDYSFNRLRTSYTAFSGRRASGTFRAEHGGYYDGTITTLRASPAVKPNARLSVEPGFGWNRIARTGTIFTTREVNLVVNYALSQKWLTRSTFVLNSQDSNILMNYRLNYIFRPGDDLFVVYSESRGYDRQDGLINRALIVKITYSLDM